MQQQLDKLLELQASVESLNPLFTHHYPVAIAVDGQFLIYDMDPQGEYYILVKQAPVPFPIPDGIRAAFPLAEYDGKGPQRWLPRTRLTPSERWSSSCMSLCIATRTQPARTRSRVSLKSPGLPRKKVTAPGNWNFPFPYESEAFTLHYQALLAGLRVQGMKMVSVTPSPVYDPSSPRTKRNTCSGRCGRKGTPAGWKTGFKVIWVCR